MCHPNRISTFHRPAESGGHSRKTLINPALNRSLAVPMKELSHLQGFVRHAQSLALSRQGRQGPALALQSIILRNQSLTKPANHLHPRTSSERVRNRRQIQEQKKQTRTPSQQLRRTPSFGRNLPVPRIRVSSLQAKRTARLNRLQLMFPAMNPLPHWQLG